MAGGIAGEILLACLCPEAGTSSAFVRPIRLEGLEVFLEGLAHMDIAVGDLRMRCAASCSAPCAGPAR